MRRLLILLAPLLATACAVGPNYRAPPMPQAGSGAFVGAKPAEAAAASAPDQWWRLYNDPVLDDLVAHALAANTDLRVAEANLRHAQAALGQAKAALLPSTNLTVAPSYGDSVTSQFGSFGGSGGGGSSTSFGSTGGSEWSVAGSLAVSWEADLFGRIRRSIEAARADADASQAARDAVRVTVAAETTRAYLNACAYGLAADVARGSVDIAVRNLDIIQAEEHAGTAGRLDVEQAASAAATARAAVAPLDAQRRTSLFELAALMGLAPAQVPKAAEACASPPAPAGPLPVGDGSELLRRRPDVREAERKLAGDTARVGVAVASLYPTVSLTATPSYFRDPQVPAGSAFSYSVGPLVTWTFPNVAVARAQLREARAQGDASLASFDGVVLTALKEVEQALAAYDGERRSQEQLREAEARSAAALDLAQLRYRVGSIAYLDVLVTQKADLDARMAVAQSVQRLGSDRVDLFKALGGGWGETEYAAR